MPSQNHSQLEDVQSVVVVVLVVVLVVVVGLHGTSANEQAFVPSYPGDSQPHEAPQPEITDQ
jgi:hypothetical protein